MKTIWFKKKGDTDPNSEVSLDVDENITVDKLKEQIITSKALSIGEAAKSDIDILPK